MFWAPHLNPGHSLSPNNDALTLQNPIYLESQDYSRFSLYNKIQQNKVCLFPFCFAFVSHVFPAYLTKG